MGFNIDAAVEAGALALSHYCRGSEVAWEEDRCSFRAALEAALPHLQGEAVPVEFDYPEFHAEGMGCGLEDRNITDRYEAMRYGFDEALDQMATILESLGPLYTHPQPAALNEVSGDSGEFDVDDVREKFEEWAKGRDLTPDTWGVSSYVSPCVDNDWEVWRNAWKALAATGKQQVGEVQGEREQFETWAKSVGWSTSKGPHGYHLDATETAWVGWQAALAARQPGAVE